MDLLTTSPAPLEDAEFYICSVIHTQRRHQYVTFWRPSDRGYCWPLSWAGKYYGYTVLAHRSYYNNGSNIAVHCAAVDAISVTPKPRTIDNDAGPVVLNNEESWRVLVGAVIEVPLSKIAPEYRGARKGRDFRPLARPMSPLGATP